MSKIARRGNTSHEAFEAVLRSYAHPAAVADLDALSRGGPAWLRYLEAFGTSCRDNSVSLAQHASMNSTSSQSNSTVTVDRNCPLVRAMIDMCGQQVLSLLMNNNIYDGLKQSLRTYGRPLPSKCSILPQHEARVASMYDTYKKTEGMAILRNTSNSVRKKVNLHTTKRDWSKLTQISIKDLKLYDAHEGKYIEGKLLVEPFTPVVGTTTILEDSNGDVILLALYNFLPDGLHGRESIPVASGKIPKGCSIRIAEPFQKVFRDGSRGIRIDDPNDISVISSEDGKDVTAGEEILLSRAKMSGNGLVQKKMYNAASEAYINGIRKADLVPTLLSNRSQAYAMIEDWGRSLADAAASLTMRPANEKTWARYHKALKTISDGMQEDLGGEERVSQMMRKILSLESDNRATEGKDALDLKAEGNSAFKKKQYSGAAAFYTSALVACGETSRALLSNWALCCLRSGANLDAVAASAASIRINPEAKAVVRLARGLLTLGEPELCHDILQGKLVEITKASDVFSEKNDLLQSVASVLDLLQTEGMQNPLLVLTQKHLPRWVGKIETFDAGSKGRGVRAKEDLIAGQVLLVEPPLVVAESSGMMGKRKDTLISIDKCDVKDPSQAYLRQAIIFRSQREGVLSQVVDCLSDGANKRPVTSLEDLIPNLASCRLLLPSHHEYMPQGNVELTADRVDAIVSVNSHGKGGEKKLADRFMGFTSTCLLPATSMFNHSAYPTCEQGNVGGCAIIFAVTDIKAGEELTICYHPNEEMVRRNWGITS
mmetsp:Transcript_11305/g.24868  ORF Transcript_11305/g.24868 Transcript_11305/m.24868 type:complete len:772 (-) Transcript_11305:116-2431(-)|eukprot:CAMPEP_0172318722 /NCGR_PEP_ID=MMETSP1058-20130122/35633_1 /TAXON_ID=83371 /ORGANISM="Detonula confervacea, Strain CCMP 353" /LENGTH=771 /DNA_ID=CAMNT_0013033611 /DNA_START=156 /DNA_END=2471 /DNA_ORIENTATION=+